jgi:hypothetical protein
VSVKGSADFLAVALSAPIAGGGWRRNGHATCDLG